ncbi:MAG: 16S rRNA (guanine(527)-N(7))-methyltransferase RsmG [Gammaproteobacteria bacterium]|nr:16S rRNA (guanine(527)-N(7))-methyltransferase RsmG [Gammaproteobacteria bacterium]
MPADPLERTLLVGARAQGIALDPAQAAALLRLISELREWNQRFNLTGITDPVEMVRKHLLDSLSVQPYLRGTRIADVGTGAGFPGLPLAVINPERQFALIEATGKKARFVRHAADAMGLANVEVIPARSEDWRGPAPFESVLTRALGKLAEFVRVAGHLCAPGGRLLAMKGRHPDSEIAALPPGWRAVAVHDVRIPGLAAARCIVELGRA